MCNYWLQIAALAHTICLSADTLRRVIYERTFVANVIECILIELAELTDTNRSGAESLLGGARN